MCLASTYSPAELDRLSDRCADGGPAWERAKRAYADDVVELASLWQ